MKIRCQCCRGTGQTELPARLNDGLHTLKKLKVAKVSAFARALGMEITASHHLMRRLVKSGFAERVPNLTPAQYRAKE